MRLYLIKEQPFTDTNVNLKIKQVDNLKKCIYTQ